MTDNTINTEPYLIEGLYPNKLGLQGIIKNNKETNTQ